ncbi:D-aminoacyl-tRNA deacylase [Chitinispirillales bacterium ANBcel5]|uniref:D-aminoacyl-tRNA deacylase n=1 Tax=Cellulosispirillum alkaliphilum TaxID=3039283 RepID=UPI002A56BB16|nr:D-aminoacyl-tRNA deacylase [Chitinispirillales bacterium ANBcel5]
MKIVLQRVSRAKVSVNNEIKGQIGCGILIFLGVENNDTNEAADFLAAKCSDLRIFPDQEGKMNKSLKDIDGEALVISQFTLPADCSRGRRPSFIKSAPPEFGEKMYHYFVQSLKSHVKTVETGVFGADMKVELLNDGPVTFVLEK